MVGASQIGIARWFEREETLSHSGRGVWVGEGWAELGEVDSKGRGVTEIWDKYRPGRARRWPLRCLNPQKWPRGCVEVPGGIGNSGYRKLVELGSELEIELRMGLEIELEMN